MSKYFLYVRGTGEGYGVRGNMMTQVRLHAEQLDPNLRFIEIDYPASISMANEGFDAFGVALNESRDFGIASLAQVVNTVKEQDANASFVLGGYSLGALVVNSYVQQASDADIDRVLRVVQVANPARAAGNSFGHSRGEYGSGITGEPESRRVPAFNVANPADGITSLHPKSPLRNLTPWLYAFSVANVHGWIQDVMQRVESGTIRLIQANWFDPEWHDAARRAPGDIIGYAFQGNHTTAYGQPDWRYGSRAVHGIQLAAHLINEA